MKAELFNRLKYQLELHEGRKNKPYKDTVGKITIGIGRNLSDVGVSNVEIDNMLLNDVIRVEKDLDLYLNWWNDKPDNVKLVLCDMAFNIGISGLLKFKNTLDLIKNSQYQEAAEEMLKSKWASQVGKRAITLSNMLKN